NLGMKRKLAPITIGLGPGFNAGIDVDIIIETMRGHDLGRLIFSGIAQPNTGVPGMVGEESKLRVIYAPCDGNVEIIKGIGSIVKEGEIVAKVGEMSVKATIAGLVRGAIKEGYLAHKGMKIGDIDPRVEEYKNAYTISDKARALGGGVLEGILYLKNKKSN
ncbi:MAG: selenium-dependent molybdenum cofactor biosynthesis protein YqeB, partial [Fusobacteriaceae bacterium]